MDMYLVALYAHFVSLVAAVVASTIVHVSIVRLRRAHSTPDALAALAAVAGSAKALPLAAAALLLTGGWLTQMRWGWHQGWTFAGIAGLLSMPIVGGVVLRPRLEAIGRALAAAPQGMVPAEVTLAAKHPVISAALNCNHAMALLVMVVMVAKPAGVVAAAILLVAPAYAVASVVAARARVAAAEPSGTDAAELSG